MWGEVGGALHASAASKKGAGRKILDNVTPSTPNREPARPRPLSHVIGWEARWAGRAGVGGGQGAGTRRQALAGSDGGG